MKKTVKFVSLSIVICMLAFTLLACGLSESKLEGIWSESWKEDGATINYSILFAPDGTYNLRVSRDYISSIKNAFGIYKIEGSNVVTIGQDGTTTYAYSFGNLHVDGHTLKKTD